MARFLFSTWPYSGHLHPCLALAGRLRRRGHEVAFYSANSSAGLIEGAGYELFPFTALARYLAKLTGRETADPGVAQALNERYTTVDQHTLTGKWRRVRGLLQEMTAGSVRAQIDDLRAVGDAWRHDAIVTDPMMWGPLAVWHEQTGMPVVPFSFYAGCLLPGRRLPVAGLGVPPAAGWAGRMRNRVINASTGFLNGPARQEVNRVRIEAGLQPLAGSVAAHSARMPLYLVASSPEYDYYRDDLPATVRYVGPCLWEPETAEAPDDVALAADRPTIYVSEGTAQVGDPFLIRAAVKALAGKEVQVIVTTGKHRDPAALGLGRLAPNIKIRQWASHRTLFPRIAAVVTTGGSGTVRQALACGVPVLTVPLEWDQLENAARLESCGAGLRLARRHCSAVSIRELVWRLLNRPRYADNAMRIQSSLQRAERDDGPLEKLEALALVAAGKVKR